MRQLPALTEATLSMCPLLVLGPIEAAARACPQLRSLKGSQPQPCWGPANLLVNGQRFAPLAATLVGEGWRVVTSRTGYVHSMDAARNIPA